MDVPLWFELNNYNCEIETRIISNILHFRLSKRKMGATRVFIFATFLVLMFGFALSIPTIGDEELGKYYIFSIFYTPTKNILGDTSAGMAEIMKI